MSKSDLSTALFEAIPEDLRAKLGAKFGEFSTLTAPSDVDSATVAMGKMCVEVQNKMLVPLSGLPVADALLYIGALTPPLIAGMFSGLEAFASAGPFDIIAPKDGGVYPGFFDAWTVRADVEALTVTVGSGENVETFDMSCNDDIWSAKWPMPIGEHTATFSDGTIEQSVSFSVVSWDTYPAENGTYTETDLSTVSIDVGDLEGVESVSVLLFEQSIDLLYQTGGFWSAEGLSFENIVAGANTALFSVLTAGSATIQAVVEFGVENIND